MESIPKIICLDMFGCPGIFGNWLACREDIADVENFGAGLEQARHYWECLYSTLHWE